MQSERAGSKEPATSCSQNQKVSFSKLSCDQLAEMYSTFMMYENKPGPSVLFVKEQCSLLTGGKLVSRKSSLIGQKMMQQTAWKRERDLPFYSSIIFPAQK